MLQTTTRETTLTRCLIFGVLLSLAPGDLLAQWWPPFLGTLIGFKPHLVGHDLNGTSLNGSLLGVHKVQAIASQGATLDGATLEATWLREGRIVGLTAEGRFVGKKKMIGAVFQATLDDGSSIAIRLDGVTRGTEPYERRLFFYEAVFESEQGWLPLCGQDGDGEPVQAIALEGSWDLSEGTATGGARVEDEVSFTLACRGHVLAKCVEAGYAPWRRIRVCAAGEGCHKETLARHHQACTRLLRADYCGDGTPHTEEDLVINLYDALEIRVDVDAWIFEAEWDEHGAVCMQTPRLSDQVPACLELLESEDCGDPSHLSLAVPLFSEITP